MKKFINKAIIGLAAGTLMVSSCDVLDLDPTGWYSETVPYSSVDKLDYYVKGFYSTLYTNAEISMGYSLTDGMSELIKYSWFGDKGEFNRVFYLDNYVTVESNFLSNWSSMYTYIRRLNEYFYDLSNGRAASLDADEVKIRTAEVRFLRAFAYQELVLRHGGVILRVSEDYVDGPNERAKARSSKQECYDFILSEYLKAAEDLPETWDSSNTGRVTKGSAWGMIARAALYSGDYDKAIEACNKVFELGYDMLPVSSVADYNKIFTTPGNKELLLAVYFQQGTGGANARQHNFNNYFCAPGDNEVLGVKTATVGCCATPTDEYASSFDIKVGETWEEFSWSNLDSYAGKPYANRDIRFYASILYDGATWLDRTLDLKKDSGNYMTFATSGQDNVHKTTTGYVFRKFLSDSKKINFSSILSGQYWTEQRAAEIYLIRSEAYARKGDFSAAYADLNKVRSRVGLSAKSETSNWDEYLPDLSKERVCELGLEGQRFFDLVRWGKAEETLNGKRLHGVEISKNADGTLKYERVEVDTQDRKFDARLNIFPIPKGELRNNNLCTQNPEWE